MAKDPAFLFYTKDFYNGVADLTMEERGQYITLLCLQHTKGHLTEKMIKINVPNASADVLAKFDRDEKGCFFNPRLETEIKKRSEHANKQRDRALKGWEKRREESEAAASTPANAATLPLGNGNGIVNKEEKERGSGKEKTPDYSKHDFFKDWNEIRQRILRSKTALNSIGGYEDQENFKKIALNYDRPNIRNALAGLFMQKTFPGPVASYTVDPKHFFRYFDRYLQAWNDQNKNIWETSEKSTR